MKPKEFQVSLNTKLFEKLGITEIKVEWPAFENNPHLYSPRVDVAIGPFSVVSGRSKSEEYNTLLQNEKINHFLKEIYNCHKHNILEFERRSSNGVSTPVPSFENLVKKNYNARCFIAFEVENTSSKKHIMGSMVNAASLGRLGIGIAYNESVVRTFIRILNYLQFLKDVNKATYDASNFLIVTKEQMNKILS